MSFRWLHSPRFSILRQWLISYLCVLLIPLLIGIAIYAEAVSILRMELTRSNESLLQQVQQTIDHRLQELEQLSTEVALNKRVESLAAASPTLSDEEHYEMFNLMRDLQTLHLANAFVDQAFIYFKSSQYVLSTTNYEDFGTFSAHFLDRTPSDWRRDMQTRYIKAYWPVLHNFGSPTGDQAVMYVRSVVPDYPGSPGVVLFFLINESKFIEDLSHIPSVSDGDVTIIDKDNRIVASTNPDARKGELEYRELTSGTGIQNLQVEGQAERLSFITSQVTGWKYVFVTPVSLYNKKLIDLLHLIYLYVALCLLGGGIATIFFVRRNYSPIRHLLQWASGRSGIDYPAKANEYEFIRETFEAIFNENHQILDRLQHQRPLLRSSTLIQLLKGKLTEPEQVKEALQSSDVAFAHPCCRVMLFSVESMGKLESPDGIDIHRMNLLHFIITNVTEEIAQDYHPSFVVEVDRQLACILNCTESAGLESFEQIARKLQDFLLKHLHAEITVSISGVHSLFHAFRAYEEALEAIDYKIISGGGELIIFDHLVHDLTQPALTGYYFPLTIEQQLMNCIRSGEIDTAKLLVTEIIESNTEMGNVTVPMVKCLIAQFTSTLMRVFSDGMQVRLQSSIDTHRIIERVWNCRSLKDMRKELFDILDFVASHLPDVSDNNQELVAKVQVFIEQHYHDSSLNIAVIGIHVDMSPSYLAKLFRNFTGVSLLDYIHRFRTDKAKELLLQSEQSIVEIAKQVGMSEISTFNRIFKKIEGVSPGKFRDAWKQGSGSEGSEASTSP